MLIKGFEKFQNIPKTLKGQTYFNYRIHIKKKTKKTLVSLLADINVLCKQITKP